MKWMGLAAAGVVAALAAQIYLRAERTEPLPVFATVPPFVLVESAGEPLTLDDLRGHVWIADFIFTTCPSFCPRLTRQMAGLQKAFADVTAVTLVSFTVDPNTDDPRRLSEYATTHGADRTSWKFLTGERAEIYELIRDGFQLAVSERTAEEALDGEGPIAHSDRFVLVDREGRIRGYYRGTDDESVERLRVDAIRLAAER